MKAKRYKTGHPTPFERRVCALLPQVRKGDLSQLEALYLEAQTEYERAHVAMQMAVQSAIRHFDGDAAFRWLRLARQHAIDDFDTLCTLRLDEAIIRDVLDDPSQVQRLGL